MKTSKLAIFSIVIAFFALTTVSAQYADYEALPPGYYPEQGGLPLEFFDLIDTIAFDLPELLNYGGYGSGSEDGPAFDLPVFIRGLYLNQESTMLGEAFARLLSIRLANGGEVAVMAMPGDFLHSEGEPHGGGVALDGALFVTEEYVMVLIQVMETDEGRLLGGYEWYLPRGGAIEYMLGLSEGGSRPVVSVDDPFEPNNSIDQAAQVSIPLEANGLFLEEGEQDWFMVTVTRDFYEMYPVLDFYTESDTDTVIEVYSEMDLDFSVAYDDDGGVNANAYASLPLEGPGVYYVLVRGFSSNSSAYDLYIQGSQWVRDQFESNDSWDAPAYLYEPGEYLDLNLSQGDQDFFILDFLYYSSGSEEPVTIETMGPTDTYLELYAIDREPELIDFNDDGDMEVNASLSFIPQADTMYGIVVRGFGESTEGPYDLVVDYAGGGFDGPIALDIEEDQYEPNDDSDQATAISLGQMIDASFHSDEDNDVYMVEITSAGTYVAETTGFQDALMDAVDGELNFLASDDDGGIDLNSRISLELEPGTYYFALRSLGQPREDGVYGFSVNAAQ